MESKTVLIKRYARSRLYNVSKGRYVTVAQLRRWLNSGVAFVVVDSETGDDITRILLA